MNDIVTAISCLCRRYVKWAEKVLLCTEEYRKTKISSLRNTSPPISKTAGIEKIFLRKILCRKNKKSPISRKPQPPQLRIFLRPKSDKQKHLQDMIAFISASVFTVFYWNVDIWLLLLGYYLVSWIPHVTRIYLVHL